jgi:hypothetical protein
MTDADLRLRLKELKIKRAKAYAKFINYKKLVDNEIKLIKALLGDKK